MAPTSPLTGSSSSSGQSIEAITERIQKQNAALDARLAAIHGRQLHIDTKMHGIGRALAGLRHLHGGATELNTTIAGTAQLAAHVSAKVRRLDEARTRVSECQQRVHDLIDLQLCAAGVTAAIGAEQFEAAAGHIDRFLGMDRALLLPGGKAEQGQEQEQEQGQDGDSIVQAVATLEAAAAQLRQLVTVRFDEAAARDDAASVERFFKIFPLLRMHELGIERFSSFVCGKLAVRAARELRSSLDVAMANRRTAVAYADTLSAMFESLAAVVEVNQPIVEACYGPGWLVGMVVRLQRECDEQFRRLLHEFHSGRNIAHRMSQIDEQLAAKTLAISSTATNTSGSSSAGSTTTDPSATTSSSSSSSATKGHSRHRSGGSGSGTIDKLNPKEIDGLLRELAIMLARADLYAHYIRRRAIADLDHPSAAADRRDARRSLLDATLAGSGLSRQSQELLNVYLLCERYFIEESAAKAIALDSHEPGQPCSSMVDDVFFIARKSIRRAASTKSLSGCCAVINMATAVLDSDLVRAIHAALRAGYPSGFIDLAAHAYNALHSGIQLAGGQRLLSAAASASAATDVSGDRARQHFIVQLNNAAQAAEHVETLWQQMGDEIRQQSAASSSGSREAEILDSCLGQLRAVRERMRAEVEFGLQQLRSAVLRPRLHSWIVEQFVAREHQPTEEQVAEAEATGDTFVAALLAQLEAVLVAFRPPVMEERTYDALVAQMAADVAARMEVAVRKCTFNRLGGLVLDREVRQLGLWLSAVTAWSVRDKLVRLTQMATLLNLEQLSELSEYWQPQSDPASSTASPAWRFSHAEVKSILGLRVDFRTADIKRLKF